jgi:hypothetical protein
VIQLGFSGFYGRKRIKANGDYPKDYGSEDAHPGYLLALKNSRSNIAASLSPTAEYTSGT